MSKQNPEEFQYTPFRLVLFFVLTFAITWAILIPGLSSLSEESLLPVFIIAAFGPFLAAVLVIWFYGGKTAIVSWLKKIFKLRISIWLHISGIFIIPIGIGLAHFALYYSLGGEPDFSKAVPWYFYLFYLFLTALLSGGNEEPGWRGFALPGLLKYFHPTMATLILGFIHGAWHLPLMNHYDTTFTLYLFNIIGLTILFNWFYFKSHKSVIPVMMFHAGTNVIGSFIPTSTDVINGFGTFMVLRGIVYWGLAIVLIILTKGRLGYHTKKKE